MGIETFDGFEAYSYLNGFRYYTHASGVDQSGNVAGRYSSDGYFLRDQAMYYGNSGFFVTWNLFELPTAVDEVIISFDMRGALSGGSAAPLFSDMIEVGGWPAPPTGTNYSRDVIVVANTDSGVGYSDGRLEFVSGKSGWNFDSGTVPGGLPEGSYATVQLGTAPAGTLLDSDWHHYGFKFSRSSGVTIYRDGSQIHTVPGAIPANPISRIGFTNNNFGGVGPVYDNMVFQTCNSGIWTTYLGLVRVSTAYALTDYQKQWTPNITYPLSIPGTSNARLVGQYQAVSPTNTFLDDQYAYVSGTLGLRDVYLMSYLRPIGPVYGINLVVCAKNAITTDTGLMKGIAIAPDGTEFPSPTWSIPNAIANPYLWKIFKKTWEVNPQTLAVWGEEEITDWKFAIEVTGSTEVYVTQVAIERLTGMTGGSFGIYRAR